jgi:capsular exopolysaccharide synthesis family protein
MTTRNPYIGFLLRWYWLLALGLVVAVLATNYALSQREQLFRATATVQVGGSLQSKSPSQDDLAIIERLVPAYAELATRDPILGATIETLGLSMSPSDLRLRLLVSPVPRTQLIDIQVVDSSPARAEALADEIARQLILQSPDTTPANDTQVFIQAQLSDLQTKIDNGQQEIADLQDEIGAMTSAADISDAQQRLILLQEQVDTWQQSYANLVDAAEPSSTNVVEQVSSAAETAALVETPTMLYYGLAAVIGLGLSSLLALGLGLLNSAVQRVDDLDPISQDVPVVTIPRYRIKGDTTPIALSHPESGASAAYRVLRNALFAGGFDQPKVTLAVTSSRSGEGKTTTVSNLGVALANAGRKVILVDANLRNPELGSLFGLGSLQGLSEVMLGECQLPAALWQTSNANLRVLPSGSVPPNYPDLLTAKRLNNVVTSLTRMADIVLFDTPAVHDEQEAVLVAKSVSRVLVVAEAGRVRVGDLERTIDLLKRGDATLLAVVLNKTHAPRFSIDRLPWSREARLRNRAANRRAAAGRHADQGSSGVMAPELPANSSAD